MQLKGGCVQLRAAGSSCYRALGSLYGAIGSPYRPSVPLAGQRAPNPPPNCTDPVGVGSNSGRPQRGGTNIWVCLFLHGRSLPRQLDNQNGSAQQLQTHNRPCTAPFEQGQTAVVPSEGVQIWVCLFRLSTCRSQPGFNCIGPRGASENRGLGRT